MEKKLVSVVIAECGGQAFLNGLLISLEAASYPDLEVIVIDNGSNAVVPDRIKGRTVTVLRPGQNLGYAEACNRGFRQATGEYICLLNNDTQVDRGWLDPLVALMERDPSAGAVASKLVLSKRYVEVRLDSATIRPSDAGSSADKRQIGVKVALDGLSQLDQLLALRSGFHALEVAERHKWAWTNGEGVAWFPVDEAGVVRMRLSVDSRLSDRVVAISIGKNPVHRVDLSDSGGDIQLQVLKEAPFDVIDNAGIEVSKGGWMFNEIGRLEKDRAEFSKRRELQAASGCSLLVRRSAVVDRLFDGSFFAYCEDVDLCLRLRKKGFRVYYEPASLVRHVRSGTSVVGSPNLVFHATRNRFWVIAKHAPTRVVLKALFREMWQLTRYRRWMGGEYTLCRLYRSTWYGFMKRLLLRALGR